MDLPKIISVDDHVVEPAHVFERWLPAKHRDRGPHRKEDQQHRLRIHPHP
jgi:hypothetical protein